MNTIYDDFEEVNNETQQSGNTKERIASLHKRAYNEPKENYKQSLPDQITTEDSAIYYFKFAKDTFQEIEGTNKRGVKLEVLDSDGVAQPIDVVFGSFFVGNFDIVAVKGSQMFSAFMRLGLVSNQDYVVSDGTFFSGTGLTPRNGTNTLILSNNKIVIAGENASYNGSGVNNMFVIDELGEGKGAFFGSAKRSFSIGPTIDGYEVLGFAQNSNYFFLFNAGLTVTQGATHPVGLIQHITHIPHRKKMFTIATDGSNNRYISVTDYDFTNQNVYIGPIVDTDIPTIFTSDENYAVGDDNLIIMTADNVMGIFYFVSGVRFTRSLLSDFGGSFGGNAGLKYIPSIDKYYAWCYAGGGSPTNKILRYNAGLTLDNTFSAPSDVSPFKSLEALYFYEDGKILTQYYNSIQNQYGVKRLNADGTNDTSFNASLLIGTNGSVKQIQVVNGRVLIFYFDSGNHKYIVTDADGNSSVSVTISDFTITPKAQLDENGRVYFVGDFDVVGGIAVNGVMRYDENGNIDNATSQVYEKFFRQKEEITEANIENTKDIYLQIDSNDELCLSLAVKEEDLPDYVIVKAEVSKSEGYIEESTGSSS